MKALEVARQNKVIGNALEAKVDLYAGGEVEEFLKEMSSELATIFIVSGVELHPMSEAAAGASKSEEMELAVKVSPAGGEKCERCWMYHSEVGADSDHGSLCPRCADVVRKHHC
ncbi:hypothetical protein N752_05565 [Desulforamulus aquiferis]|nr:hypothetical protein N752_05565 [Desulforamulus aquiferis]